MTDSQSLLAEYAQSGSDAAFRELVTRYVDLVYSTALRLVERDAHRAEDVTQTVFVDLARKARTLPADVKLGGWLHRDTCFVAATLMRGERRRQSRERQAVEMNALQMDSGADYSLVAPLLDEAINELGETERTAILLRFYERQDFRSVGEELGSNEDAARMRVTRALEKLEGFLKRRGITTSAASLGVALTANAVQAAPVGLAVTISTTAALAGTTIATTATKAIVMTTLQKALIATTLVAAVGTGIYEARQASNARAKVEALQQQHVPLNKQIAQLESDNERLSNVLAGAKRAQSLPTDQFNELLRLRGEVGVLRHENETLAKALKQIEAKYAANDADRDNAVQDPQQWAGGKFLPKELLSDVGASTPAKAMQTFLWAKMQNNFDMMRQVVSEYLTNQIDRLAREFRAAMVDATGIEYYSQSKSTLKPIVQPLLKIVVGTNNTSFYEHLGLKLDGQTWKVYYDDWSPAPIESGLWHDAQGN